MIHQSKISWALSTAASAGLVLLAGCGEKASTGDEDAASTFDASQPSGRVTGEEEISVAAVAPVRTGDPVDDDVEFIYRLGLIRGHLSAFIELYRAGEFEMAARHVKHPNDELYADLRPAFEARQSDGFAEELEAIVAAAAARSGVDEAYTTTVASIRDEIPNTRIATKLLAISQMATTAAEEFDVGVDDSGAVTDPHEYQDAFGFLMVAREMLAAEASDDINESEAIAVAHEQIDLALNGFSGLIVENTDGQAATIYGAASVIERAAKRIE